MEPAIVPRPPAGAGPATKRPKLTNLVGFDWEQFFAKSWFEQTLYEIQWLSSPEEEVEGAAEPVAAGGDQPGMSGLQPP